MTTKLTLTIESKNVRAAKKIAKKNNTSVSALVNNYFARLQYILQRAANEPVHPLVKEHSGSLSSGHKNIMKEVFGK